MLRNHRIGTISRRTHRGFEARLEVLAYLDAQQDMATGQVKRFGRREPTGQTACAASCGHPACAQGCTLIGRWD